MREGVFVGWLVGWLGGILCKRVGQMDKSAGIRGTLFSLQLKQKREKKGSACSVSVSTFGSLSGRVKVVTGWLAGLLADKGGQRVGRKKNKGRGKPSKREK